MGDIIFKSKQYKKEEFVYYPSEEPQKRMMYCSAFYNLVIREKAQTVRIYRIIDRNEALKRKINR